MKKGEYITDKKLSDRRFLKTEMSILEAFGKNPRSSISSLTKMAHISRPTFYRHHKAVFTIINDYEKYLSKKCRRRIRSLSRKKNTSFRYLYQDILLFILSNKKLFRVLVAQSGGHSFYLVIEQLRPNFVNFAHLPKNSEQIFRVYAGEVTEILLEWSEKDFPEDNIVTILNDIMYLSETARTRLLPLVHKKTESQH